MSKLQSGEMEFLLSFRKQTKRDKIQNQNVRQ